MKSSIVNILDILNSAFSFTTSGFAGGYRYDSKKAADYFDELKLTVEDSPIFFGILIMEKSGDNYTIIDGLQRIITLNLLLCALCKSYKGTSQKNEDTRKKVLSRFLFYEGKPKLKLKGEENNIYKKIVLSKDLDKKDKSSNLYQVYNVFLKKIKESKLSGNQLYKIISRSQFMLVLTDKSEVSVRDLYQTINNNKEVSQINLISDFVSHKGAAAKEIWGEILLLFSRKGYLLEAFLKDFLITRLDSEMLNPVALYNNFKNYYNKMTKYQNSKTIFENIYKYATYYLKVVSADFEKKEVKSQIRILNKNGGKDTYPYLMEVLDDLENGHINEGAFLNILMMVNLFIKSRQELTIDNINIDFGSLSKELNKMLVLKDYVPDILHENKLTINQINNLANFEV